MTSAPVLTTFRPIAPRPDVSCGICYNQLEENVVAHLNGQGHKHPFHQACIDLWLRMQTYCPFCQVDVVVRFNKFDWTAYAVTAIVLSHALPILSLVARIGENVPWLSSMQVTMGVAAVNLLFLGIVYHMLENRSENWRRFPIIRAITQPSIAAFFLYPLSVVPAAIMTRSN